MGAEAMRDAANRRRTIARPKEEEGRDGRNPMCRAGWSSQQRGVWFYSPCSMFCRKSRAGDGLTAGDTAKNWLAQGKRGQRCIFVGERRSRYTLF